MTEDFDFIEEESTEEKTDKKCPNCGGVMDFDPASGKLFCPYCESFFEIGQNEIAEEEDIENAEFTANFDWGTDKKVVICKSCGGETVYDALDLAGECPYCGSNQVIEHSDNSETMAPGGVVPFSVDKKKAGERFSSWIKSKIFCPGKAKKKARPESFKGIYLPFWTFDSETLTNYKLRYGIDYTYTDSKGNSHTSTHWHSLSGSYEEFFDDFLVSATSRHDVKTLISLAPYNTADSLKYNPEYLAGFASERYSVGIKDAWERAKDGIKKDLESHIKKNVEKSKHADHVSMQSMNVFYGNIKYKYLLLPVWISSFRYKEKPYQFMVNGQTGKVAGKAPVSPLRVAVAVALGVLLVGLAAYWFMSAN